MVCGFRFQFRPAALPSQFLPGGFWLGFRAIARLQPGFQFANSDCGLDLLRSLLDFRLLVFGRALVRLSGSSPRSGLWFQVPAWACSACFSISGFRFPFLFPAGLSCDCPAPARIAVSDLLRSLPNLRSRVSSGAHVRCPAPAQIQVSSFRGPFFRFGFRPAPLASNCSVSGFIYIYIYIRMYGYTYVDIRTYRLWIL